MPIDKHDIQACVEAVGDVARRLENPRLRHELLRQAKRTSPSVRLLLHRLEMSSRESSACEQRRRLAGELVMRLALAEIERREFEASARVG